jgi:excisionase family DNA binding protein
MTLDDDLPPILTVDQTAAVLGISRGLAFAAVRDGDIPSVRIGRRILVPRDQLLQVLLPTPAVARRQCGKASRPQPSQMD